MGTAWPTPGAGVQHDGLLGHGHGSFLVHEGQLDDGERDGPRTVVVSWSQILAFH